MTGIRNTLVHTPEIQVKKSEGEYKVRAKLPGAKKEDIKVEVENGHLTVSGKYEQKRKRTMKMFTLSFAAILSFKELCL